MRQDSLRRYGQDLYPNGPLSAYRTYDQQAELYQQYLDGTGAPADPPGTSSHELGDCGRRRDPRDALDRGLDRRASSAGARSTGPTEWWHVDYYGGG